jgi:3-hydroxyacyl-[acyl-carrier-protein] dehydratase
MANTEANLQQASIADILRHIPHRYPFVFIDRMESFDSGKIVRMTKLLTCDEWFMGSHSAVVKVMPSMLVVEALAQAAGALSHYSGLMSQVESPIMFFAGIDECRFGADARPGDKLLLECTLIRSLRNVVKVSGRASVNDTTIAELKLTAVIQGRASLKH